MLVELNGLFDRVEHLLSLELQKTIITSGSMWGNGNKNYYVHTDQLHKENFR